MGSIFATEHNNVNKCVTDYSSTCFRCLLVHVPKLIFLENNQKCSYSFAWRHLWFKRIPGALTDGAQFVGCHPQSERLPVWFPVRAQTRVAGSFPVGSCTRGNQLLFPSHTMFLSFFFSLLSPLSKHKSIKFLNLFLRGYPRVEGFGDSVLVFYLLFRFWLQGYIF